MANITTKFVITSGPGKFDFLHCFASADMNVNRLRFGISARNRTEKLFHVDKFSLLSPCDGSEGQEWTFIAYVYDVMPREDGESEFVLAFYSTTFRKGKLRRLTLSEEKVLSDLRLI